MTGAGMKHARVVAGTHAGMAASAIQFIDCVFERLPFRVEVVQTDNSGLGPEHVRDLNCERADSP